MRALNILLKVISDDDRKYIEEGAYSTVGDRIDEVLSNSYYEKLSLEEYAVFRMLKLEKERNELLVELARNSQTVATELSYK